MSVINRMLRDLQARQAEQSSVDLRLMQSSIAAASSRQWKTEQTNKYRRIIFIAMGSVMAMIGLVVIALRPDLQQPMQLQAAAPESIARAGDVSSPVTTAVTQTATSASHGKPAEQRNVATTPEPLANSENTSQAIIAADLAPSVATEIPAQQTQPSSILASQPNLASGELINSSAESTTDRIAKEPVEQTAAITATASVKTAIIRKPDFDKPPPQSQQNTSSANHRANQTPAAIVQRIDQDYAGQSQYYQRGLRELEVGNYSQAEAYFRDQLARDSQHLASTIGLAKALQASGRQSEVMNLLAPILAKQPKQLEVASIYANAALAEGDVTKAKQTLESANAQVSSDIQALSLLAASYQQAAEHEKAVSTYESALTLSPQQGRLWVGYGISLEALGRKPQALAAYRRGVGDTSLDSALANYADSRIRN